MKGAVVDVDGTVLRGETVIEGAREGVKALRAADVRVCFVSNNPTFTSEDLGVRLRDSGIEVGDRETLTSATLTARYVEENCSPPVHVTGEAAVTKALRERGINVTKAPVEALTSVVSLDRHLGYEDIRAGYEATRAAEDYLCTDPDSVVPTGDGDVPGSGAVEAAVSRAAGREPSVVGKPSEYAGRAALDSLGTRAEDTVFVGDRLDTDVALGESVGATTAFVRTGVTYGDVGSSCHTPDHILDSLAGIADLL